MIARNSDRDTWKLAHWDEYISKCDFSIPKGIGDPAKKKELILFYNSNEKEFQASMKEMLEILQK